MFLQSEIDEWLKRGAQKSEEELLKKPRLLSCQRKGKKYDARLRNRFLVRHGRPAWILLLPKTIQNIETCRAITVVDVYRYLVGHYAKPQTDTLRSLTSSSEAKKYKATHFDYCTFSGLFRKRNEKELIQHSGLMCLDFDHVGNTDRFKEKLLKHDYFDTELMFTSPSGDGVKWIIPIDLKGWEHSRYFKAVASVLVSSR